MLAFKLRSSQSVDKGLDSFEAITTIIECLVAVVVVFEPLQLYDIIITICRRFTEPKYWNSLNHFYNMSLEHVFRFWKVVICVFQLSSIYIPFYFPFSQYEYQSALGFLNGFEAEDTSLISFDGKSLGIWGISPDSQISLLEDLSRNTDIYPFLLTVDVDFMRSVGFFENKKVFFLVFYQLVKALQILW